MLTDVCGGINCFSSTIFNGCLHSSNNRFATIFRRGLPLVIFACLVFFTSGAMAQEKDKYLFEDSSVMNPSEAGSSLIDTVSQAVEAVSNEDSEPKIIADTILLSNELKISTDSVIAFKTAKPFAYARILDSLLKNLKKQQEVKYTVQSNGPSALDLFFSSFITKVVLWSLGAAMLLFILYKLFFSGGIFLRRSATSKVKVIAEEEQPLPDVNEYSRLIKQAVANHDYRLATRYLYLQSLQNLIDRDMLTYAADKTNYEYLSELTGNSRRQPFAALTLKYEYVWYGGFIVDETAFAGIQQSFNQFNNEL